MRGEGDQVLFHHVTRLLHMEPRYAAQHVYEGLNKPALRAGYGA